MAYDRHKSSVGYGGNKTYSSLGSNEAGRAYSSYGIDYSSSGADIGGGPQRSEKELENFYNAYLSLPDRVGSAAGFIEIMIDHYNMLDLPPFEQG